MPATAAIMRRGLGRDRIRTARVGMPPPVVLIWSSAPITSAAEAGRASGSFFRQRSISRLSCGGTSARRLLMSGGSRTSCAVIRACPEIASSNGCRPARSSHATSPQRIEIGAMVDVGSAAACSGAMYAGVPTTCRPGVSVAAARLRSSVREALSALAMPKSVTTAAPPESRMFSGLMSRCTTPSLMRVGERARHVAQDADRLARSASAVARRAVPAATRPSTNGMV